MVVAEGLSLSLFGGVQLAALDATLVPPWGWYTPEEGRRERWSGPEARSRIWRRTGTLSSAVQTGGRASGRSGRGWRTLVSGGAEVPAMSGPRQCEVRSEESPSERAGGAAQEVERTIGAERFATSWRSRVTPGLGGRLPRVHEVLGDGAWACFGDCGADFLTMPAKMITYLFFLRAFFLNLVIITGTGFFPQGSHFRVRKNA